MQRVRAALDEIALRRALPKEWVRRALRVTAARKVLALPLGRTTARLYELFVLRATVDALAELLPGWEPRYPPDDEAFWERPYYRLALPQRRAELIWQRIYSDAPELPLRSKSYPMRPDIALERGQDLFILDAKYGFRASAPISNLQALNSYQNSIVRRDGSEATLGAVAVTGYFGRSHELYYRLDFFNQSGLGLVYLPFRKSAALPGDGARLTLPQALGPFLAP